MRRLRSSSRREFAGKGAQENYTPDRHLLFGQALQVGPDDAELAFDGTASRSAGQEGSLPHLPRPLYQHDAVAALNGGMEGDIGFPNDIAAAGNVQRAPGSIGGFDGNIRKCGGRGSCVCRRAGIAAGGRNVVPEGKLLVMLDGIFAELMEVRLPLVKDRAAGRRRRRKGEYAPPRRSP